MNKISLLLFMTFFLSCGEEKTVILPEINQSKLTEIHDVSAGYLFYDETKKDSAALNRKNLISTTNWLINVDKRLTLKQAIPHIKYLQNKKDDSSHKKEGIKNYFTCHDTSKNNLGFIEFTNIVYIETDFLTFSKINNSLDFHQIHIKFLLNGSVVITLNSENPVVINSNTLSFLNDINTRIQNKQNASKVLLSFDKNMTFQAYITVKDLLISHKNESVLILNTQFIY